MRLTTHQILNHPLRRAVLELVSARPGLAFLQLRARLSGPSGSRPVGMGTLAHHLRTLERAGLVAGRRSGRCRRYYAGPARADAEWLALLHWPETAALARVLPEPPASASLEGLRAALPPSERPSRAAAARHLARLADRGLARVTVHGRAHRYASTPTLAALLAAATGPAFPPGSLATTPRNSLTVGDNV